MTEEQWLTEEVDPYDMVNFLGVRISARKARLFAVACVRAGIHGLHNPWQLQAVEVGERAADGLATDADLRAAQDAAVGQRDSSAWAVLTDDWWSAVEAARFSGDRAQDRLRQCQFARDLFGNPFRSILSNPWWLTTTAVALATRIYEERAYDRMPILADALEEAGCDDVEVLNHCRNPGLHVRGCWVVDLVLGRE